MVEIINLSSPSIFSAIQKLRVLLARDEKVKWLGIAGFACVTSIFEIVTAMLIVLFAQVLTQPEVGKKYLVKIGMNPSVSDSRVVFYVALMVGGVYLLKNLWAVFEVFFQNTTVQKIAFQFRSKLLHKLANLNYGFYLTRNSSFGMHLVSGDADTLLTAGMVSFAIILSESLVFFSMVSLIVYMNPSLAFIIFSIGVVLSFVLVKWMMPIFYGFGKKLQIIGVDKHQHLNNFFQGFKEIVLLNKVTQFVKAYDEFSVKKSRLMALQTSINTLPRIFIETLFVGLFVVAISYMCLQHETTTGMLGVMGGYLYTGFRLMPGLNRMINQLNTVKSCIPSVERLYEEYIRTTSTENYKDLPALTFTQSIDFKNVFFRYLNTQKDALQDINFSIEKGERIGIVGETGSGKSTLIDLLLGLITPNNGTILVDNQYPVNSFQWHAKIGYVPQSIYLTDNTIAANIAFGETDIDMVKINQVIDAAQLRKFIDALPNGAQTIVGERGVRLSGGERQRIAIARALYRNPEVLIFDEATSALDNETEARLMGTINQVSFGRTVIMIAHRLTTLKDCDRVVEMAGGKLKNIKANSQSTQTNKSGNIHA